MSFSGLYRTVGGHFRRKRKDWLLQEFAECKRVVDLGGTVEAWSRGPRFDHITMINVIPNGSPVPAWGSYIEHDACSTEVEDRFDLAHSNSAIEHLGTWERQQQFAREMLRLGRRIYCQTPNRWFPLDPHYLTLFLHWLPPRWFGYRAHRYLTLQGLVQKPTPEESHKIREREGLRFLTKRELKALFPGCRIRVERFCGLPKSYAAWN